MKIRTFILASLLGLSSTLAFAQTAAINAGVQQQLDAAIAQGNTAQIAQIAASNPQAAVTIAQRVANAAQAAIATNPTRAATLAAAATSIVTAPAVNAAVSSNPSVAVAVANVAKTSTDVTKAPAVKAAVATSPAVAAAVNTITSNASTVISNPAVQSAAGNVVVQINVNIMQTQTGTPPPGNFGGAIGTQNLGGNDFNPGAVSGGGGS